MPFKYRSITANCGNDVLGEDASKQIAQFLRSDDADFFVINCQEAHFGNTQKQLEDQFPPGPGYKVKCLSQMVTRTKPDTILGTTGMATFVICKENLELTVEGSPVEARRNADIPFGSAYNKGGLVTHFTVKREGDSEESIKIQAVTGHLDASNVVKRNQDWRNLYRATVKEVGSWEELVNACPDLMLSGYDANTRNKFNKQDKTETNMWVNPEKYPEIHALHLVSKAAAKYSKDITYEHTKVDPETGEKIIADQKREGDAARGMLDFVTVFGGDPDQNKTPEKIDTGRMVVDIAPKSDSERDHSVVISPPQTSRTLSEFDRVKNIMAARLSGVAPDIANKILDIPEGKDARGKAFARLKLMDYYNDYLGPNGFLDKAIELHVRKLEYFQQITQDTSLDKALKEKLKKTLFAELEWCAGDPRQLEAKQELMHALLDSLAQSTHVSGIEARLACYFDLKEKIANNEKINAADAFKEAAVKSYQDHYLVFEEALKRQTDERLRTAMMKIQNRLNAIVDPNDANALKNMDPKKLDTLTQIVAQCHNSSALLKAGEIGELDKTNKELISLSHDAMGSSSPAWRALANAVKFFVSLISDALTNQVGIVQDKKLSDAVIQYSTIYKSALQDIIPPKEEESDQHISSPPSGG